MIRGQKVRSPLPSWLQLGLIVINIYLALVVFLKDGGPVGDIKDESVQSEDVNSIGSLYNEFQRSDVFKKASGSSESLSPRVWSTSPESITSDMEQVRKILDDSEIKSLHELCGRTLYHGLENVVVNHDLGHYTFFATGDLPLMWIRDSAFQIGVLMPKISKRPALRFLVEGGIRLQAFYILQDPYANGYYPEWKDPFEHNPMDRRLGRGGWVGVRNYELDSGAYFLHILWDYWSIKDAYGLEYMLREPIIVDAVKTMVDVWILEQNHNASSPYRYVELSNNGHGTVVKYTGMIWSGFRPSDDANKYGFSIPSNMFVAGALQRALNLNAMLWKDSKLHEKMTKLLNDVETGIEKWGIIEVDGVKVYAYEVDGQGNHLIDFDDPNWPSLVSIPLLGWDKYDKIIYETTKSRLFSTRNRYYFTGDVFTGLGSPHTPSGMAWALGTLSEAMTAKNPSEKAEKLRLLLKLQCNDGLMHESVHVSNANRCSRRWFEWANSLLVTAVEHLIGVDCDQAAEDSHRNDFALFEAEKSSRTEPNPSEFLDAAMYRQGVLSRVQSDVKYVARVQDWKGTGHTI